MNDSPSRIEIIAARLDQILPPHQRGVFRETKDPLLKAAVDFANAPFPELSPEAMARVKTRMLKAYTPRSRVIGFPSVRRLSMVASLAVVLLAAGLIPATAASLPGETLYPLKLEYERVELLVAAGLQSEGEMYVVHSERRLNEADALLQRGIFSQDTFSAVLVNASHALQADPEEAERVHSVIVNVSGSLASAQQANIADQSALNSLQADVQTLQTAVDASEQAPVPTIETPTDALASPTLAAPEMQGMPATQTMTPLPSEMAVLPESPTATLIEDSTEAVVAPVTEMATETETSTATITSTSTETATYTPTSTGTPTATITPTMLPTVTATKTATPTLRPRPRPTRTPEPVTYPDSSGNSQPVDPGSQGNSGNGQPADPGSQGNSGNGQPADPGSQGNSGNDQPVDPGSQGNSGNGQPADPGSQGNTGGGNAGGKGR